MDRVLFRFRGITNRDAYSIVCHYSQHKAANKG